MVGVRGGADGRGRGSRTDRLRNPDEHGDTLRGREQTVQGGQEGGGRAPGREADRQALGRAQNPQVRGARRIGGAQQRHAPLHTRRARRWGAAQREVARGQGGTRAQQQLGAHRRGQRGERAAEAPRRNAKDVAVAGRPNTRGGERGGGATRVRGGGADGGLDGAGPGEG